MNVAEGKSSTSKEIAEIRTLITDHIEEERGVLQLIRADVAAIMPDVAAMKHMVVGNGDIGLCEQVRNNSRDISEWRTMARWLMFSVGALILSVIGQAVIWYLETRNG